MSIQDATSIFKKKSPSASSSTQPKEKDRNQTKVTEEDGPSLTGNAGSNDLVDLLTLELKSVIKEATDRAITRLDWLPNLDLELFDVPVDELADYARSCEEHIGCLEEAITELQGVLRNQYREENEIEGEDRDAERKAVDVQA